MKKIQVYILTAFLLISTIVQGQDYLNVANVAFEQGQYEKAIENYKNYQIFPAKSKYNILAKLNQAENCLAWKNEADNYLKNKKYEQAQDKYQKIINVNPRDSYAKEQINECKEQIATKEKRQKVVTIKSASIPVHIPVVYTSPNPTGNIMIYSKSSYDYSESFYHIDIWIDGVYEGMLDHTKGYISKGQPFCGEDVTITKEVSVGIHKIEAIASCMGGIRKFPKTYEISITEGACEAVPLDVSEIIKNFSLSTTGKIMIYSKSNNQIDIWIDDAYKGKLSKGFPNRQPSCEDEGTITVEVSAGWHRVKASLKEGDPKQLSDRLPTEVWHFHEITHVLNKKVSENVCTPMVIDFSKQ